MKVNLLTLSRFFLYLAVFAVVVVMRSTFFPFIGGKYFFFRGCIEAALALFLLWWAFEAESGETEAMLERLFRQPVFIATSLFMLAVLVSTILANNAHGAFWSNFERGEGAFQMLHYYAFFAMLLMLFDRPEQWRLLFRLSLFAAIIMIWYGVVAATLTNGFIGPYHANSDGSTVLSRLFSDQRFQGSLGNPAYVAPYLIFTLFYAAWLYLSRKATTIRRFLYGGFGLFFLLFFAQSQTRGAFLGLAAGILAYIGFLIVLSNARTRRIAAAVGVMLIALWMVLFQFKEPIIDAGIPGARFLTISLSESTAQTRFWTWNSAWQGVKERPLFGWGLENFSTVFDRHFDSRHFVPGANTETWFDRAHSIIFDYMSETGMVGLATYMSIFAILAWYLWVIFRKGLRTHTDERPHVKKAHAQDNSAFLMNSREKISLFAAVLVAYLVQGIVLFDVLPIYMNLFIVFAFGGFLYSTFTESWKKEA